jgi:hypothetical protein
VFIGGVQTNAAGSQDFMVKAYDALTRRLFQMSLADAGGSGSVSGVVANSSLGMVFEVGIGGVTGLAEYASQAVVAGERLFMVGVTSFSFAAGTPNGSVLIRAYDAK